MLKALIWTVVSLIVAHFLSKIEENSESFLAKGLSFLASLVSFGCAVWFAWLMIVWAWGVIWS